MSGETPAPRLTLQAGVEPRQQVHQLSAFSGGKGRPHWGKEAGRLLLDVGVALLAGFGETILPALVAFRNPPVTEQRLKRLWKDFRAVAALGHRLTKCAHTGLALGKACKDFPGRAIQGVGGADLAQAILAEAQQIGQVLLNADGG
ncbi:hypothetical protein HC928_16485 [bacterium]|nr:hypothetical protein [bacterium]